MEAKTERPAQILNRAGERLMALARTERDLELAADLMRLANYESLRSGGTAALDRMLARAR